MNKIMKRTKMLSSSRKGMTLVEVLVALSILMLIIFVFTPLFASYINNIRNSGEITRKTYKKASLMERLLANSGKNDRSYESNVNNIPLTLTVKDTSYSVVFGTASGNVGELNGKYITTDADNEGGTQDYVTFLTGDKSKKMVCFPKSLTDDFLEKEIILVPIGFDFAFRPNTTKINKDLFTIKYTLKNGNESSALTEGVYYEIDEDPYLTGGTTPGEPGTKVCVKIKFKGGNETICFQNSPLHIYYSGEKDGTKAVTVEIIAPKIIMVGEKANDTSAGINDYYYYATSGVDPKTGKMDIIAKQMGIGSDGSKSNEEVTNIKLKSSMNDVEWVEKGRGDDGNGGVNDYGYYIMGGDAGQVRRFWRSGTSQRPGNYYWDGDNLYNYDRDLTVSKDALKHTVASGDSHETITEGVTTQASFKSVFHSGRDEYELNGNTEGNVLMGSSKLSILDLKYASVTTDYYTANVTSSDDHLTTLGRILNYTNKNAGKMTIYAGNSTEDWMSNSSDHANRNLYTTIGVDNAYGKKLDIVGYKDATNYEYNGKNGKINDDSLITITSVGAIQINTKNSKYYKQSQTGLMFDSDTNIYPTESYTLYCGRIPSVTDVWGWASGDQEYYLSAELGVATNGESWYPVGKFGDTQTASTSLSSEVFKKGLSGGTSDALKWKSLLNYSSSEELYPSGLVYTGREPVYKDYDIKYEHQIYAYAEIDDWGTKKKYAWITLSSGVGGTNSSNRAKVEANAFGISGVNKKIKKFEVLQSQIMVDGVWVDDGNASNIVVQDIGSNSVYVVEGNSYDTSSQLHIADGYTYKYREPHLDHYNYTGVTSEIQRVYYGPNSTGGSNGRFVTGPNDAPFTNGLTSRSFVGTALAEQGNNYFITSAKEVDVTMGYLSQPYAITVGNPETPYIRGVTGSDYFFKKFGSNIKTSKFDHSFFSGGLRDNVTMLDIKSYYDDVKGNNISIAVGYSLSYLFNDYSWMIRLGHVMNNGMVYIRATGDGTIDAVNEKAGDIGSGKGWSLAKETNVFHQFYGIDQYQDSSGTSTAIGWDTNYHRAYFNLAGDPGGTFQWLTGDTKAPQANYSPNTAMGNQDFGTNCHPLAQTQVNCVNWGATWDDKPQAMWGTDNGTLMSWFYSYEQTASFSKITSVRKEFESYMWIDRVGGPTSDYVTSNKSKYYDAGARIKDNESAYSNGFISVLSSINCVYYGDGYWIAVGDQSGKDPQSYCGNSSCYTSGGVGSYINVKHEDENGNFIWTAVKISSSGTSSNKENWINFISVEYCEGIWYAMGYYDKDHDGEQDADEECVMYYALDPSKVSANTTTGSDGLYTGSYDGGWRKAATRNSASSNDYTTNDTKAVRVVSGTITPFKLQGINSMASQG